MHPRSAPRRYSVVNTPRGWAKCAVGGSSEMERFSSSERMDSWARRSSWARSSGENSAFEDSEFEWSLSDSGMDASCWDSRGEESADSAATGLGGGSDIAFRLTRGNGLGAPAENEGAAATFYSAAVDLRPEGDEVVDGRYQRNTDHEPEGDARDKADGKEKEA